MRLSELIPILQERYKQVMVTGPQRSGTTIASKILAEELERPYIDEGHFHTHNLAECFRIYNNREEFVIQAPAMAAYCHLFPGAIVFMKRPVHEILLSQRRVKWPSCEEERERAKYFLSEDKYCAAEIKYRIWYQYQAYLPGKFELDYYSMQYHRLWVPENKRKNFTIRQTEINDN